MNKLAYLEGYLRKAASASSNVAKKVSPFFEVLADGTGRATNRGKAYARYNKILSKENKAAKSYMRALDNGDIDYNKVYKGNPRGEAFARAQEAADKGKRLDPRSEAFTKYRERLDAGRSSDAIDLEKITPEQIDELNRLLPPESRIPLDASVPNHGQGMPFRLPKDNERTSHRSLLDLLKEN